MLILATRNRAKVCTMLKEQTAHSPSVVCIHMNVDNKSQPCGQENPCTCHDFCNTQTFATPDVSRTRRRKRHRKRISTPSSAFRRCHSGSSESCSSAGSNGVLWQQDIENSKPKESTSTSTSSSAHRDNKSATHRQGILREDPKSRARRTKTRSRRRHSRSSSESASSADDRKESNRLKESKEKRISPGSRRSNNVYHRKHNKPGKYHYKKSRRHRRRRSKSPTASSTSSSRSGSNSDVPSGSSASRFVSEFNDKKSSKKAIHLPQNIHSDIEYSSDGERKGQFLENYSYKTLCAPELRAVELINTIGIVNDTCAKCQTGRGHTICVCKQCMNKQQTSPACLVCSQCYMIPSSNTDHPPRVLAANCKEMPCTSCQIKPHARDERSHRKTHRHKSGRKKSPERREGHGHTRSSHEKKGVDRKCVHSCHCADCIPTSCPQFYQCNLLLGQCCTPVTSTQCVLFHRDNLYNHTRNRSDSQCTLNESQCSVIPTSQLTKQ